jgi:hypothetical protein
MRNMRTRKITLCVVTPYGLVGGLQPLGRTGKLRGEKEILTYFIHFFSDLNKIQHSRQKQKFTELL